MPRGHRQKPSMQRSRQPLTSTNAPCSGHGRTQQWSALADNIEVWSQDGRLVIGIHDQLLASQAFALEFGDEHTPPSPLFRTMGPDQEVAQGIMSQSFASGMERVSDTDIYPLLAEPNLDTHRGFILGRGRGAQAPSHRDHRADTGEAHRPSDQGGRLVPLPRGRAPDQVPLHHHRPALGRAGLRSVPLRLLAGHRGLCTGPRSRPTCLPRRLATPGGR